MTHKAVVACLLLLILTAGCKAPGSSSILGLDEVIDSASLHSGDEVYVRACVSVTPHGMGMYDCDNYGSTLVMFEPLNEAARKDYESILNAGFKSGRGETVVVELVALLQANDRPPYHVLRVRNVKKISLLMGEERQ